MPMHFAFALKNLLEQAKCIGNKFYELLNIFNLR